MTDTGERLRRLNELSPERRRVFEKLHAKQIGMSERPSGSEGAREAIVRLAFPSSKAPAEIKESTRQFYDSVSRQLDMTPAGECSYFLNFGYVPDASPSFSPVALPDRYLNKNCVRLVLELIGDCDVTGRDILDVGCGRGGTVHVLTKFLRPKSVCGVVYQGSRSPVCQFSFVCDGSLYRAPAPGLWQEARQIAADLSES